LRGDEGIQVTGGTVYMKFSVAVLAAGLGTRMRSDKPKVLHTVLGKPMIQYVIDAVKKLRPHEIVAVINPSHDDVREYLSEAGVDVALQRRALGTADAVKVAFKSMKGFQGNIVIVNGDTPLIAHSTLKKFISRHEKNGSVLFHTAGSCGGGRETPKGSLRKRTFRAI
jgi:bifunctional N-acetylglucosamine-1-phosphate-uridyltransferase/glucosamine-1-phosphate-acetyltransferase GlmU-like protein